MKNQNLKENLEIKKGLLNSLKIEHEKDLTEKQKGFWEVLLMAQKQIIQSGNAAQQFIRSEREKVLERAKRSIKTKLSETEVKKICQNQNEITKIKMELKIQVEVKTEISLK